MAKEYCYIVYKRTTRHMNNDFEKLSGEWEIKVDRIFKLRKSAHDYIMSDRAGYKLRHFTRKALLP